MTWGVEGRQRFRQTLCGAAALALAHGVLLAQAVSAQAPPALTPLGGGPSLPPAWALSGLPERYKVPTTQVTVQALDGLPAMRVWADHSWGGVSHNGPGVLRQGTRIAWSWRLEQPLPRANIELKALEDSPLKLCLSFDMPTNGLGLTERARLALARSASGMPIAAATLCYVWGNTQALEHQTASPVTSRVRYLVVSNLQTPLNAWQRIERDVQRDYSAAFGHEFAALPPIVAIGIGADSDNTEARSLGWVRLPQWLLP